MYWARMTEGGLSMGCFAMPRNGSLGLILAECLALITDALLLCWQLCVCVCGACDRHVRVCGVCYPRASFAIVSPPFLVPARLSER